MYRIVYRRSFPNRRVIRRRDILPEISFEISTDVDLTSEMCPYCGCDIIYENIFIFYSEQK